MQTGYFSTLLLKVSPTVSKYISWHIANICPSIYPQYNLYMRLEQANIYTIDTPKCYFRQYLACLKIPIDYKRLFESYSLQHGDLKS